MTMAYFYTLMVVWLIDGGQELYVYDTYKECGAAIMTRYDDSKHELIRCVPTNSLSWTAAPRSRPEEN